MTPPNLSLLFIMICFWLTMWLVHRFLLVPVGQVLAERQRRLDDAQAEWDGTHQAYLDGTARVERQLEEAARAAAAVRAEHRQRALADRQATLEGARELADQQLQAALSELERDVSAARSDLGGRARELARLFAGQLLEREVRP